MSQAADPMAPALREILPAARAGQRVRPGSQRQWAGLAFIAPSYLFILALFILPLGMTGWMSLNDWPLLGESHFIGTANYRELLGDGQFWSSMAFTVLYTVLVTVAIFAAAFPLALIANAVMVGSSLYRTVFFMPMVIGFGAASTLWLWLVNPDNGVVAKLLIGLRLIDEAPRPIESFWPALALIVAMVTWKTAGFTMVILLTGLQTVSSEVLEAARMDGARALQRFVLITVPLMRSSIGLALILCVTSSMLAFDQFYIMTQGGPQNATVTAVFSIYLASFASYRLGYGAAMSVVLLCILMAVSSIQLAILGPKQD